MFTSTTNLNVVAILFVLLGIWAFVGHRMAVHGSRLIVTAALKRFASDFGLKFWTDRSPYHFELARLVGRSEDTISNVLLREMGDAEFIWFEVFVYKRKSAFHEPRVAIRRKGYSFPKFALAKGSLVNCAPLWWEMQRVLFGEDALDARLKLFGDDAEAVRRLFIPSLRERIAGADIPTSMIVRGDGEWLLFNVKGFRSFYVWPSVAMVTLDLKTFLSWMSKAIGTAGLFLPIEAEATKLLVPAADGLLVRGAGRGKEDTMLILAAVAFGLLVVMSTQVEGDYAAAATGILLAAALITAWAFVSRLYKRALARTIDSLARGL